MTKLGPYELYNIIHGNCLEIMPSIPDNSIDAIFADPPYPYIKRAYGYWTEETWMPMMQEVARQSRRVLKPHGSAVFVLQPNSEKVGKMRLWLWRFMVWAGEEWGIVQDIYWWNTKAVTTGVSTPRERGLTRASIKNCLWLGEADCYRNQEAVLIQESERNQQERLKQRFDNVRREKPSGQGFKMLQTINVAGDRGGTTPFNILPIGQHSQSSAGAHGHGAGTPAKLVDWWLRYITKPGNTVLDMFSGSGTTGLVCLNTGRRFIGIEKDEGYFEIAKQRLKNVELETKKLVQLEMIKA